MSRVGTRPRRLLRSLRGLCFCADHLRPHVPRALIFVRVASDSAGPFPPDTYPSGFPGRACPRRAILALTYVNRHLCEPSSPFALRRGLWVCDLGSAALSPRALALTLASCRLGPPVPQRGLCHRPRAAAATTARCFGARTGGFAHLPSVALLTSVCWSSNSIHPPLRRSRGPQSHRLHRVTPPGRPAIESPSHMLLKLFL